jgi:hypothetical protein
VAHGRLENQPVAEVNAAVPLDPGQDRQEGGVEVGEWRRGSEGGHRRQAS